MPVEHGNFPPTNLGGKWCLCMSDRLLTAVPLQMSSCSTWKHHLFGPNSCCSESTNTLCEGHEQGNLLHLHAKITHALFKRLEIERTSLSEFPGTSLLCTVYMTVCIDIQKTAHVRSLGALIYWWSQRFNNKLFFWAKTLKRLDQ